jgi:hypothetical protein
MRINCNWIKEDLQYNKCLSCNIGLIRHHRITLLHKSYFNNTERLISFWEVNPYPDIKLVIMPLAATRQSDEAH